MATIDVRKEDALFQNSPHMNKAYSEVGGGGEVFDFITLHDGKVICIGNGLIGVYASWNDFEAGDNDALSLVPLKEDNV
jgi:hypothetical protein